MEPNRSWMFERIDRNRVIREEFVDGVARFLNHAKTLDDYLKFKVIKCPCEKCECTAYETIEVVRNHLYRRGFWEEFGGWTNNGEIERNDNFVGESSRSNVQNYRMTEMVHDAFGLHSNSNFGVNVDEVPNDETRRFYEELHDASRPLFEGSPHSKLSIAVSLLTIKSGCNVTQGAMDRMMDLYNGLIDPTFELPDSYYKAKRLVSKLGLSSIRIDCCENGCMLYIKEDANLELCKFCSHPRYKRGCRGKKLSIKAMHYLPLIPRLKRLYASNSTAPHMRWHHENRRPPGVMCHPSDGLAWQHFDRTYPDFAVEPLNVRLGLCADGFTPFSFGAAPYSCWPVFITPYNLPPEMLMTSPYIFLSCVVPGPHYPKGKIDVFLQPLIDELKLLWSEGVQTWDISLKQNFNLRAVLMWTVNDFPAYGMLSGWMTAGKLACPYCMENCNSFTLKHGRKNSWFDCHRRFLPSNHEFRRMKHAFRKNKIERDGPPPILTGHDIWERVQNFPKATEEQLYRFDGYGVSHNWTKQSIFWELPYWKNNLLRHNLDVMHIEKNYFDNLFNTVMDVTGKTKDNAKARLDLPEYCRRPELHLKESTNNKVLNPKASYTFTIQQKRRICEWVRSLKMLDGYSSNLGKRVDMVQGILHGMKSHDCHVFMEQLIPIAFSGLPERIWKPMAQISLFFKELCSSTLTEENLNQMEVDIVVITNKLEKILPPGFFDVMEHLPIHLVHEARLGGPMQTRWMYPFERTIGKSKRGVKNKSSVEGSIVEAYLVRETSQFCSYYFDEQVPCQRKRPNGHHDDNDEPPLEPLSIFNQPGICAKKQEFRQLTAMEKKAATLHVLLNCPEVLPFLDLFVSEFGETQIHESFATWYFNWVFNSTNFATCNQFLKDISFEQVEVHSMPHYTVNGFKFATEEYSKLRKTNNSGVWVKGEDDVDYFGVLQEILNMEYAGGPMKKIILFLCKWFDPTSRGTRKLKEHNIIEVKHTRTDKSDWWVVIKTKPKGRVEVENVLDVAYQNEIQNVHQVVDTELVEDLQHVSRILEEVDIEELQGLDNEEPTYEEDEWTNDEESSEEDEWIDSEASGEDEWIEEKNSEEED